MVCMISIGKVREIITRHIAIYEERPGTAEDGHAAKVLRDLLTDFPVPQPLSKILGADETVGS